MSNVVIMYNTLGDKFLEVEDIMDMSGLIVHDCTVANVDSILSKSKVKPGYILKAKEALEDAGLQVSTLSKGNMVLSNKA